MSAFDRPVDFLTYHDAPTHGGLYAVDHPDYPENAGRRDVFLLLGVPAASAPTDEKDDA